MNYTNFNLNFLLNLSHVIFERLCIYGTYIATTTTSNNNNELKNKPLPLPQRGVCVI